MATEPLPQIRACRKCGVGKPANTDYFYRHGERWLRTVCRDCSVGVAGFSERKIAERETGLRACRRCGSEKPHDREHFVLKLGKLTPLCRECNKAISRAYFQRNREHMLAGFRDARKADPEFHRERQRRYYQENPEAHKASDKRYREANPEKRREFHRRWAQANPDRIAGYGRAYQQSPAGRDSQKRRSATYWDRHRDRLRAEQKARYYEHHAANLEYQRKYYAANRERFRELARVWNRNNKAKIAEISHRRRVGNGSGIMFAKGDVSRIYGEQDGRCAYCEAPLGRSYEVDHFIPLARGGGNEPENILLACRFCNRSKGAKLPWKWRPDLFRPPIGY